MRIASLAPEPFHSFPYQSAAGAGKTTTYACALTRGTVTRLPEGIDALVLASDLQGMAGSRLLGEALADELLDLSSRGALPAPHRIGVLLAGDLFSAPLADTMGATGRVDSVWRAFAAKFAFAAGVAGNHDVFDLRELRTLDALHILDGDVVDLGGVRFGGVGGVIGNSSKNQRRKEREYLRALKVVLDKRADVVILHQGPDVGPGPDADLRGHEGIREALEEHVGHGGARREGAVLVVCGHCHWRRPTAELKGGTQVVNADGRVLVLQREGAIATPPSPAKPA